MDRDSAVGLTIALNIIQEDFINIYQDEPMIANVMLNKFKQFLNDEFFSEVERQMVFIKFLHSGLPNDAISDMVSYITNECDLKSDYLGIILDWNLEYDNIVKRENLYKYDGEELSYSFEDLCISKANKKLLPNNNTKIYLIEDIYGKKED